MDYGTKSRYEWKPINLQIKGLEKKMKSKEKKPEKKEKDKDYSKRFMGFIKKLPKSTTPT